MPITADRYDRLGGEERVVFGRKVGALGSGVLGGDRDGDGWMVGRLLGCDVMVADDARLSFCGCPIGPDICLARDRVILGDIFDGVVLDDDFFLVTFVQISGSDASLSILLSFVWKLAVKFWKLLKIDRF